ncbi:MAG: hypothetical protein AABM67_16845 [Acidobacteriota bacterium]
MDLLLSEFLTTEGLSTQPLAPRYNIAPSQMVPVIVSGQWAVDGGQRAVGGGQWAVGSGDWAVGSGQWAVGSANTEEKTMKKDVGRWRWFNGDWCRRGAQRVAA